MRAPILTLVFIVSSSWMSASAATLSREDALSRVQSDGYGLVSKAEEAPGSWDVWASKDGIPYEVKINAADGSVIAAVPLEAND